MGSPFSLWGMQRSCIGMFCSLLCLVPYTVAGATKVCNFVSLPCPDLGVPNTLNALNTARHLRHRCHRHLFVNLMRGA